MRYDKYLRTRKWKEKRKEVLELYGRICMICGKKASQVHHLNYENVGKEDVGDLIPLCKRCHKLIHGVL